MRLASGKQQGNPWAEAGVIVSKYQRRSHFNHTQLRLVLVSAGPGVGKT